MYAFVHIEKNAGTTVINILRRSFGTRHCDIRLPLMKRGADQRDHRVCVDAADLRGVRRVYRNLRGISGHNVKPYADLNLECPEIRFFTFLRDPAARFRSHFLNRADGHDLEAFERWVNSEWVHNWQTKMLVGEPNVEKAIEFIAARIGFVGLTERFDESLVMLGQWLAEPGFRAEYRRENQLSQKRRPRDVARQQADMSYLDSEPVRARIAEANAEDQKVYDYVMSSVYPRQIAAFRGNLELEWQNLRQQNRSVDRLAEPALGRVFRNYVYKPLLHCHVI
jgi:Sulfotransferase family